MQAPITDRPARCLSGRLLYIEDHPLNALLCQQWAAHYPELQLTVAETGTAGIEVFLQLRPDAVLLDMLLPDMTGLEVLARLRALPCLGDTPVAMLSASVDPQDMQRALAAGAHAYWTKPVDFRKLERDVRKLLGHAPYSTCSGTCKGQDSGSSDGDRRR